MSFAQTMNFTKNEFAKQRTLSTTELPFEELNSRMNTSLNSSPPNTVLSPRNAARLFVRRSRSLMSAHGGSGRPSHAAITSGRASVSCSAASVNRGALMTPSRRLRSRSGAFVGSNSALTSMDRLRWARRYLLSLLLLLALSQTIAIAQTRRRNAPTRKPSSTSQAAVQPASTNTAVVPSTPARTPAATTPPATTSAPNATPPSTPIQVVVVNGQTISTSDFDPAVRQQLETVENKIADARRAVLDLQINTLLLQIEAKKRGIDTHRLYELEVSSRIPVATPTQIKKFVADRRSG